MKRRIIIFILLLVVTGLAVVFRTRLDAAVGIVKQKFVSKKTVEQRLLEYGDAARKRLRPYFDQAQVPYPPKRLLLLGIKDESRLEVYASGVDGKFHFIRSYPILAASGVSGPKLLEGDGQVPEGIYAVASLNPNSSYHLALRVGYPNAFDREQAKRDGRENLGGDIMIHGKAVSIGCLAMGDEAAEDLFVLVAETGLNNIEIVLTPVDFRRGKTLPKAANLPAWSETLYETMRAKLRELPANHP